MIFFLRKSLKICSGSNLLFRGVNFDLFSSSVHFFLARRANSTVEQQKCKGHEKHDRLLVSKVEFNFQISHRNKNFTH